MAVNLYLNKALEPFTLPQLQLWEGYLNGLLAKSI
jgi:hypothetical protein